MMRLGIARINDIPNGKMSQPATIRAQTLPDGQPVRIGYTDLHGLTLIEPDVRIGVRGFCRHPCHRRPAKAPPAQIRVPLIFC
jgi:hypothetical protein